MLPLINNLPLHVSGRDVCWLVLVAMVTNAEGSIGQASRLSSGIKQYSYLLFKENFEQIYLVAMENFIITN